LKSDSRVVRLTMAQALVRHLQAQVSERDGERQRVIPAIFGIFGHGNVCGLGQALLQEGSQLPFYQPKNEQSMVHTALGYAKATRRLSTLACTASIGPGSSNMLTGAATATTNRIPVLLLPSDTFSNRRQGPVLQQLEHPSSADMSVNDCFRPVSRFFDRITRPEQLLAALPEAIRVLLDPAETGAVTLCLPQDVQGEAHEYPLSFFEERVWHISRQPPARSEVQRALELVKGSQRPLIIAGGGVRYSGAEEELVTLANECGIPVSETSAGKGTGIGVRSALGGVGVNGTGAANETARDADLVLCVGTRLTDFTTASHSLFQDRSVKFVGVNTVPADARKLGAAPVVGDAKLALTALLNGLRKSNWTASDEYQEEAGKRQENWRNRLAEDLRLRSGERMSQGQLLRILNRFTEAGDWVVAAAGSPPGDLLKLWEPPRGSSAHIEFGYSCMGHEIPSAIGIRMALPEAREIYVVIGDGTYLMCPTELVTAAQEGMKITVLLIINEGYQSIHSLQLDKLGVSFGNEFRKRTSGGLVGDVVSIDLARTARGFGATVFEADSEESFHHALMAARSEAGPTVIAASVEPRRGLLSGGAWWDLGMPQESEDDETSRLTLEHARRSAQQRFFH
jgi:3D-(3,5/4)-trihydroxycyclohexane-1,2-dione acylhydrolase (decyclizing)